MCIRDSYWGRSIEQTNIRRKFGLNIIALIKSDHTNVELRPDTVLGEGDIIAVSYTHLDVYKRQ